MAKVVVPVGLSVGPDFASAAGEPIVPWQVRVGVDVVALDGTETAAWGAATRDPVRYLDEDCGRTALESALTGTGTDPGEVIGRLLARDLLVEYDRDDGPWRPVFDRIRLFPLANGLGNSAESPGEYRVAAMDEPTVALGVDAYVLWSYSFTSTRSLWQACEALARGAGGLEDDPHGRLDAADVAQEMAAALPLLVASGCGFLDPAEAR